MRKLIIIRGASGSGKTTAANMFVEAFKSQNLRVVKCEADEFFYDDDGCYNFDAGLLGEAHLWCRDCVNAAMSGGADVIVLSNTNTADWELHPYLKLAEKYGYTVDSFVKENLHEGKSVHDVPLATLERQKARIYRSLKL